MSFWSFLTGSRRPDPVMHFAVDDTAMIEASAKAVATLPVFWAEFDEAADTSGFLLKVAYTTPGGDREHLWLDWIKRDGERLEASLANEPQSLPGLHARDRIAFDEGQISDWAYPCAAGYHGHYTTRAILPALDAREAAQIEKTLAPLPTENSV